MKKALIHISNYKELNNSKLFSNSVNSGLSAFYKMKKHFLQKKVRLNTLGDRDCGNADVIILLDIPYSELRFLTSLPFVNAKKILYIYEPPTVNPFNYFKPFHSMFDRVYTWNDALVDGKKYFKFKLCAAQFGLNTSRKSFKNKKFLILVNGNKSPFLPFEVIPHFGEELYSKRLNAIDFFEKKIPNDFELWGKGWNKPKKHSLTEKIFGYKIHPSYQGTVDNKIELLSNFKFCLCFENLTGAKGYLTEKIFDCFKAKCVPIYWGADNITDYIPSNCFIDYRKFMDFDKLLSFIQSMDPSVYEEYVDNIEKLLKDEVFLDMWFEDGWVKTVHSQVISV
jgi:hypothetical protein